VPKVDESDAVVSGGCSRVSMVSRGTLNGKHADKVSKHVCFKNNTTVKTYNSEQSLDDRTCTNTSKPLKVTGTDLRPSENFVKSGSVVKGRKFCEIFVSNISSLSEHAKVYLAALPAACRILMLSELHKEEDAVSSFFNQINYSAVYSPPELSKTGLGTHGGELVAVKSGTHARNVSHNILEALSDGSPFRFAVKIISFSKVDIMFISLYLWDSEGFSERNNNILKQIYMLINMTNLPVLIAGDFNIPFEKFCDSGWCERLKVKPIHPGAKSTTSSSQTGQLILV
jgi:hypothetical protein